MTTGCSHEPMDQSRVRFDAFKDFLISACKLGFLYVVVFVVALNACYQRRIADRLGVFPFDQNFDGHRDIVARLARRQGKLPGHLCCASHRPCYTRARDPCPVRVYTTIKHHALSDISNESVEVTLRPDLCRECVPQPRPLNPSQVCECGKELVVCSSFALLSWPKYGRLCLVSPHQRWFRLIISSVWLSSAWSVEVSDSWINSSRKPSRLRPRSSEPVAR